MHGSHVWSKLIIILIVSIIVTNQGDAQLDCSPVQVVKYRDDPDYSLRMLNTTTDNYDLLSSLPFVSGSTLDAVGILHLTDGQIYALGALDRRLCLFDLQHATCFETLLHISNANVGTVVHNSYYYAFDPGAAHGTPFYVMNNVDTTPSPACFHTESSFSFNTSLFAGALFDVAPVNNSSSLVTDDNTRSYLVGLGEQSELVIIKLNASDGYPESYAVLPSIFKSKAVRLGTGYAAFAYEPLRIFFASNDGYGIYELETPLRIPGYCWNAGHDVRSHVVCENSNAFLHWVHEAPPTGNLNDGLSCQSADRSAWPIFREGMMTLPTTSTRDVSSIASLHFDKPRFNRASLLANTHNNTLLFAPLASRSEAHGLKNASQNETLFSHNKTLTDTSSLRNMTVNLSLSLEIATPPTATRMSSNLTVNETSLLHNGTLHETLLLSNITLNVTSFPFYENFNTSSFLHDMAVNATSLWNNGTSEKTSSWIYNTTRNMTFFSHNATHNETSLFEHSNINEASFKVNASLNETSLFNNATLNGTSMWHNNATSNGTTLRDKATLNRTSWENATLNETHHNATLKASFLLNATTLNATSLLNNVTLNETLSWDDVTFNETLPSQNVTLNETYSSHNVTLNETLLLSKNVTQNQTVLLNNVTLNETLSSNNLTINETLSWRNDTLNETLSPTKVTFNETLSWDNVTLNETLSWRNFTLNETTLSSHNFTLNDTISQNNSTLNKTAPLYNGTLNETNTVDNGTLTDIPFFKKATLNKTSAMINATLNDTLRIRSENETLNQSLLINATVNQTLHSPNGTLNETIQGASFNNTRENATSHEMMHNETTSVFNETTLNQTFLVDGDSSSNASLLNNGSIFIDCDTLQYPLQVASSDDGNILRRLDSTNGDYVIIERLDYYNRGRIDAAGIAQVNGGYSAFASFDGYLCRFNRFRRSCFNTSLQSPDANAGAVIENVYYYASDLGERGAKPVYFVTGIESEMPIFTTDHLVLVSDRLFSKGAVLDMVAVDEMMDGVEYVEDDVNGRYLIGLGAGFETLVVRINRTSGYPQQYAVLNPRDQITDAGPVLNATGFAAFAFRETNEASAHRIYFVAIDGRGLFEVTTPIFVPEYCWNSGQSSETHRACNGSHVNVTRRGNAAAGGDDGLNCPDAVWFPAAASSIPNSDTNLTRSETSNTTVNQTTYLPTSSYSPSYSPTADNISNASAILAYQSASLIPTMTPIIGPTSWLPPSISPVSVLSNIPTPEHTYPPSPRMPSRIPTTATTPMPTPIPTTIPSTMCGTSSCKPTAATTPMPTPMPTPIPTAIPSTMCDDIKCKPTAATTPMPTPIPTAFPSRLPDTPPSIRLLHPTSIPSALPTILRRPLFPSSGLTVTPNALSSIVPTSMPTPMPTPLPSVVPSVMPFDSSVTSSAVPTRLPSSASIQLASVRVSFALDFNASEAYTLNSSKEVVGGAFVSAVENCVGFDSVAFVELSSQTRLRTRRKLLVTDTRRQVNIAADVQVLSSLDEGEAAQVVAASVEAAVESGALTSAMVAEANATGFDFVSNEMLEGAILVNESLALISNSIAVTLNTLDPTAQPTILPSIIASVNLTMLFPTSLPSAYPTRLPSVAPSRFPTVTPSHIPSSIPTHLPSKEVEISSDGGKSDKTSTSVLGTSIVILAIGVAIILLLIFIIVIIYWQARKAKQMVYILTQSHRHSLLNQLPGMDNEISPSSKSLKSDAEQQPVFRAKPEETLSPFADNLLQRDDDAGEPLVLLDSENEEDDIEEPTPRRSNSMDESQDDTIHFADDTSAQESGSVHAEPNLHEYEWEQMLNDVDGPQAPEDWNMDAASILLFRLANSGRDRRDGFASKEDIMVTLRERPDLFDMLGLSEIDQRGQLDNLIQNTKVDADGCLSRHQFLLALEIAHRQIEAASADARSPPRIEGDDALGSHDYIPGLPVPPFLREQSIVIPPPPLDEQAIPPPPDDGNLPAGLTEAPAAATSPLEPTYSQLKWNVQIAPVSPSDA